MGKYTLRLPDGSQLTAIRNLQVTWQVNDDTDISLGSACAAMLEAELYLPAAPEVGQTMSLWEDDTCLGLFLCSQVKRIGSDTLAVTAYDRMVCFDRDITAWLEGLSFPMEAQTLLEALCLYCGVTLEAGQMPQWSVVSVSQTDLSGRQLLKYLGQLAGGFWQITPQGSLQLDWYPQISQPLSGCRMDSLTCDDASAAPIARVLIRDSGVEVGAVWPDGSQEAANTYILEGNPLLPPGSDRQQVAQRLYDLLQDYQCTPFSCALLPGMGVAPGQRICFTDASGRVHTAPVMTLRLKNGQRQISATASPTLQSVEAFNRLTLAQLEGRMLTVERTAQGLQAEHTDLKGNAAALSLTLESITSRVTAAEEKAEGYATQSRLTELEQKADSLALSVTQLQQQTDGKAEQEEVTELTEHFLFDARGLTISNTGTGMGITVSQEQVAFTGGSDPTTVITPNAMQTTNLHIATRLDVGGFSLIPRTNRNLSLRYTSV